MPYPFKNILPQQSYQEVMRNNPVYPSSDLIDFSAEDKAVDAQARLHELDAQIEALKQKIAEKKASDILYNKPASTFDYIIAGDRSGLDRIAQQKFNEEQSKLQRDLTEKLANKQNSEQEQYKRNEIANKYELANTDYELALQTFNPDDPASIANLKRKAQMLNYYGSQLGFEPVSTDAPASRTKTGVEEQKDYEGIATAALSNKSWTDETRNTAFEAANNIKDVSKRNELLTKIVNRGSTKEDKERTLNVANEEFKKTGKNPNKKLYKVIFINNKPDHLEYK